MDHLARRLSLNWLRARVVATSPRVSLPAVILAIVSFRSVPGVAQQPSLDFARDIQPILQKRCHACHGPQAQMKGLRFDHRQGAIRSGFLGLPVPAPDPQRVPLTRYVFDLHESPSIFIWISYRPLSPICRISP